MVELFCSGGEMIAVNGLDRPLPKNAVSAEIIQIKPRENRIEIRTDGTLINTQKLLLLGTTIFCAGNKKPVYGGFLANFFNAVVGCDIVPTWDRCLWVWHKPPFTLIRDQEPGDILVFRKQAE